MMQRAGACILFAVLGYGCGVGDDDVEDRDPNPNKITCTDAFKVTGTWTAAAPLRDASTVGCWPVGTWNFTVSIDPSDENVIDITNDGKPDRCGAVSGTRGATFDQSYSFTVSRVDDGNGWVDSYLLNGTVDQGGVKRWNDKIVYRTKVTEGGAGQCEGGLELYSTDSKEFWNLHPSLNDTVISGFGDYVLYKEAQL